MTKTIATVREAALDVLEKIDKQQSYSNLLLNQVIQRGKIKGPDIGLLTEIVYGTIQRKMTLDYYLQPFLRKKPENWVLNLLRLSLYQMVYLDKIPERAIFYEAVEIAKKRGHKGIASYVNGILRRIQREGVRSLDLIEDPLEKLAISTSHPLWLVKRWHAQLGLQKTEEMCKHNLHAPVQTARVNLNKVSKEEAIRLLSEEGFDVEESSIVPEAIRVLRGNIAHSDVFKKGYVSIQDESSMAVGHALTISPNLKILDACAAPGGKTGHIAELLKGTGQVIALDLHPHKIKLIQENAERLGLTNIDPQVMDSRELKGKFKSESFDRILVDAPCSGLGVLRRKPDIKYTKTEQDVLSLSNVQLNILNESANLLKKGGILVYSTCTVDQDENFGVVHLFLEQHNEFEPQPLQLPVTLSKFAESGSHTMQILPQDFGGDGFFIASFKKKDE